MAFINYKSTNNATSLLQAWLTASATTAIVTSSEWDLFPSAFPFLVVAEKIDTASNDIPKPIIRREIIKVTWRTWDTLTVVRWAWTCVWDDTAAPKVQGTTQYAFDTWDKISLYVVSEDLQDIKTEIATDDNNSNLMHKSWAETVTWNKTYSGTSTFSWAVNLTAWNIPIFNTDPTISDNKHITTKLYVDALISWYWLVKTIMPLPMDQAYTTAVGAKQYNSDTTMTLWFFALNWRIEINKISILTSGIGVATPWTIKIACFAEDWQTKLFEVTTATISATDTVYTTSLWTPVTLSPWNYYIWIVPVSTFDWYLSWFNIQSQLAYGVIWGPIYSWTLTVTASTVPTTISPTWLTQTWSFPMFRLDN